MARAVVGLFNSSDQARQAIRDLKDAGFTEDAIGLVDRVIQREDPVEGVGQGQLGGSTEAAVAGGVLGGSLGALLAATGALVIPGIGPFISGGILATTLIGGASGWLVGGLAGLGVPLDDAAYYEEEVQAGRPLVTVRAGDREEDARAILLRDGAETIRKTSVGQTTGGLDPEMADRAPSSVGTTQSDGGQLMNRAQTSGQWHDMVTSESDDGTVPPTAVREAITTPPADAEHTDQVDPSATGVQQNDPFEGAASSESGFEAHAPFGGNIPGMGTVPGAIGAGGPPLREPVLGSDRADRGFDRLENRPYDRGNRAGAEDVGVMAGNNPQASEGGDNPDQLSPSDPHRQSDEGQPYLDDTNPYGRDLRNRDGRPIGGVGNEDSQDDPQHRRAYEVPGEDGVSSLDQSLSD